MNLETFFDKFELFADAPDAVAKMRELIFQMAVSGDFSGDVNSWEPKLLGQVARLRRGYDLPTHNRKPGAVPIFAANGPVGVHETAMVKGPGVVTGRSGSIGKVHFVEDEFWPLNTALYVEDFFGNDPQFICLLLRALHLERFSTATAVPTLNRNVVHRENVRVPPLAEQKRIVAKVDELMALCDRLEAQQQEREARHAALARASLARFAEAATPANLEFLFHNAYAIPPADLRKSILTLAVQGKLVASSCDSVREITLGEILSEPSFNGISKGPVDDESAVEVLRISAGTSRDDFYVDESDFKHVSLLPAEVDKALLQEGDLLACRYNGNLHYVGRFSMYAAESGRVQVNPDKLIRFRVDRERCDPRYVCYAMNAAPTRERIEAMCATTAGNIGLSAGKMKAVGIPLPPLAEQHRIVAKADELMALVDKLEAELASARTTASNLIAAAVAELTQGKPFHASIQN